MNTSIYRTKISTEMFGAMRANKPLAHEVESYAVIESSKPEKSVLIEPVLANLSNRVKRGVGRWAQEYGLATNPIKEEAPAL